MPPAASRGYTLIFPSPSLGAPGPTFHFSPSPERIERHRRALTTLIELPQAIYRESHGEGIQNVSLEGTFGVRARLVKGTSLTGTQVFDQLEALIENYWKRLATTPKLQVEFHDHGKDKHHYAEIMSFAAPKGSENKMHDRYAIELRLYAPIKQTIKDTRTQAPGVADLGRFAAAQSLFEKFTNFLSDVSKLGVTLSKITSKASEILNRYILQPVAQMTKALGDFVAGVTDLVAFPFRTVNRIYNAIADFFDAVGDIVGDTLTTAANTLRQMKRALYRVIQAPELFKSKITDAAADLADAFTELVSEVNPLGTLTQASSASKKSYTGVKQVKVRAGDTLQRIALRELGDASLWHDIALVNGFDGGADLTANATILIPTHAATPQSAIAGDVGDTRYSTKERLYGRDLRVVQTERNKLSVVIEANNDLATVAGEANLMQAVMLKTRITQGTLLENKDYGLRPLIGKAQSPENAGLLAFGLRVAAESDPRIAKATVEVESTGNLTRYSYQLTPLGMSQRHPIGAVVEGLV